MSFREKTDAELYDQWCAGDRRAGGELAKRYLPLLRRLICDKVSDGTAAKDVLSTVLLQLVKSRAALKDPRCFRPFVIGIARNVLRNHYRKHGNDRLCFVGDEFDLGRHTLDDLGIHPPDLGPKRELVRALHRLPIEDQQLLMVYYEERLTYDEIAEAFELKPGTVASRLSSAKARVREVIDMLERTAETSSAVSEFGDWADIIRRTIDNPAPGAPRKVGSWRQVKFEPTGIDTFRAKYRRWLKTSRIEFEVRRPKGVELRAIEHGTVAIGDCRWILEANREHDAYGLRLPTSAGREMDLTHRKASNWDGVIEFASRLDLAAI